MQSSVERVERERVLCRLCACSVRVDRVSEKKGWQTTVEEKKPRTTTIGISSPPGGLASPLSPPFCVPQRLALCLASAHSTNNAPPHGARRRRHRRGAAGRGAAARRPRRLEPRAKDYVFADFGRARAAGWCVFFFCRRRWWRGHKTQRGAIAHRPPPTRCLPPPLTQQASCRASPWACSNWTPSTWKCCGGRAPTAKNGMPPPSSRCVLRQKKQNRASVGARPAQPTTWVAPGRHRLGLRGAGGRNAAPRRGAAAVLFPFFLVWLVG